MRRLTKIYHPYKQTENKYIISGVPNIAADFPDIVGMEINKERAVFISSTGKYSCCCMNGKFPNYKIFIPNKTDNTLEVNFTLLKTALKKLKPFFDPESTKVTFNIK